MVSSMSEVQHVLRPASENRIVNEEAMDKDVKLRIHFDDLKHPAIASFLATVDPTRILANATRSVYQQLYKQHGKPPAVRSITLVLEPMGGVAYTTGLSLDDLHKEIHVSLEYLANRINDPLSFRHETIGVIVHEMVHVWQHNCNGSAPGGLIEGIADYVRLKSGLAPPHWKTPKEEPGKKWDEGYQHTAFFLEWLEEQHGQGTISRMNNAMDGVSYDEKKFWHSLFDDSVDSLWKKYLAYWDSEYEQPEKGKKIARTFDA